METQNEKIQNERDTELYEDSEKKKLEIELKKQLGTIESGKFKQIVDAIGSDTIIDIANAGPELQAKLLEGLGFAIAASSPEAVDQTVRDDIATYKPVIATADVKHD